MSGHTFSQPAYNLTSTSMFTVLKVIRELKVHQQQSEDLHFTRFWHFFCSRHISKLLIKHAIANSPCYHYYNMINMMWTQGKRHLCIWDGLVRAAHRGVALEGAATWGNHLAGPLSLSVCPTFAFSFGRGIVIIIIIVIIISIIMIMIMIIRRACPADGGAAAPRGVALEGAAALFHIFCIVFYTMFAFDVWFDLIWLDFLK